MKTRPNNDMTNYIGPVYVENDSELSWLVELGVTKKRQDNNMIDHTSVVYAKIDIKLS